jgi:catechol 2,3-dioxygenase
MPDFPGTLAYFTEELDFSIAEMALDTEQKPAAAWIRRTRTTHDVALLPFAEAGFHHFSYLVPDSAGLIRTADLLADAGHGGGIQFGPGRHGVSNAMTMYFLDPDGNRIEFFTGDVHRDLDRPPLAWSLEDYERRGRFWWGATPSPEFRQQTPILPATWPGKVAARA